MRPTTITITMEEKILVARLVISFTEQQVAWGFKKENKLIYKG